jgi:hypothetical protein
MENRPAMLALTGALAFGSLGYFLFVYDDGTVARQVTSRSGTSQRQRPTRLGPGAASGHSSLPGPPGMPGAPLSPEGPVRGAQEPGQAPATAPTPATQSTGAPE